jgi:hypothetical protein
VCFQLLGCSPSCHADQPVNVIGDIEQRQRFGGDTPLTKAEVFGAFGGVFSDVTSSMLGSQITNRAAIDSLGIELGPEAQHQTRTVGHRDGQPHLGSGLANRLSQPGRIDADLGRLVVLAGPVEPDQRVEVHHATALELGDLDERHPAAPGELGRSQSGLSSQGAAQGDSETAP